MHFYPEALGKFSQIGRVGLIGNVGHHDMGGNHFEVRFEYFDTGSHQLEQSQRIFTSRYGDKYTIALFNEAVLCCRLMEFVAEPVYELLFFAALSHILLRFGLQNYIKMYKNL